MGTINPAIPTVGQPNSTEDVDVRDSLTTIRDEINGNLDNANIKSAANIDGSKLASASVNGSKLVDNSVSPAKISNGTAGQLLVANSSGVITSTTVTGDVTISDTGVTAIGADKVTDTQLRDDASTDANRAVTTNHIRDDAVDANKLRDDASTDGNRAVTTNHIRDNAINRAKVNDDAIGSAELDFATASANTSTDTDFNASFGTNFSSTISLDPGVYLVTGEVSAQYKASAATVTLLLNTASGTASISPSTFATGYVSFAVPNTNLHISGIVTVTATASISLRYISDDTWTRIESHLVAFGIKS